MSASCYTRYDGHSRFPHTYPTETLDIVDESTSLFVDVPIPSHPIPPSLALALMCEFDGVHVCYS
jgi:hypothetical protein